MIKKTIILITISKSLRKHIFNYLADRNIRVKTFDDTATIPDKVKKANPQMILIDDNISNIEPEFICKKLKKEFPSIPLILLTNQKDTAYLSKFLKIPIQDFVVKPVNLKILHARIVNNIEGINSNKKKYENGKLKLDTNKKKLFVNNKKIDLTPKEYRLIKYLMANKGKVLSREQILNNVWGFDAYVIDRNVDVYIGNLRAKLNKKNEDSSIKTVPSFGYMLKKKE